MLYKNTKKDTYLKFDKNRMTNLEYSLEREILRTNRRGAYHCTTLVECNTRKQHGLLVIPVPRLDDSNHVLLSSLDETVIQHGAEFNLGIHKYDGDNYSPRGHKYIREFDCDSLPKTIYRVGGVVLSKEKMFSLTNNTIFIRYTLLDAHSPTIIRFRPFLAFREINELTSENSVANHGYKEEDNGISMCMYTGYPNLYMQLNKKAEFIFEPYWNKGIEYLHDQREGLPYKEDLYVPGYFEVPIKKGESIIFSASDTQIKPEELEPRFENGIKIRTPRSSFYNCLKNSGNQFYFRPSGDELYLLNGYPWGKVTARSQFMSLPGLTLCIGNKEAFEEIMDTAIPSIRNLISGKPVTGFLKDLDGIDVLLWVIKALKRYQQTDNEAFYRKYTDLVIDIIQFLISGKHPKLIVQRDGLLSTKEGIQQTIYAGGTEWNGEPVMSRHGCLVEVNAFWHDALMFAQDIAEIQRNEPLLLEMKKLSEKVKRNFIETFVNDAGYLYDFVDGNYVDWNVRPSMLFAVSTDYPLLEKRLSKSIMDIITKELLTSKGIRTLSPKGAGFKPRYEGSFYEREYSKYNGGAYPFFLGAYVDAYIRVFQRSGYAFLDRLLIGIEEEMANDCIGSISEVYDGSLPYRGHGMVSYAVNVAGVLYALATQEAVNKEYV
ncbi:glycogen debranching enzyme N-terminal domain-containing protein [Dysgonomonas sp. 25]|uniref:glycogen debranching enzyme N-terminal domain-containing protein n=1 Tax=Dysgonomonas sp. 25 TaxID=2302933 RepID=UPI0013D822BC|nr:glycogen debranching enzyme N-terminal domain-containing protein [Dysgonomonas sp. 25]NDV68253.1 4-alpha-glucanotransferase [Dysgonomonas sp. 25]